MAVFSDYVPTILGENRRLLLQAALGEGVQAAEAYEAWRKRVPLDEIDHNAFRVLAHVVDTANRHRIVDPDMPRIRGVLKHTWINNMLRARALAESLGAIEQAGIDVMVLKGAALFGRFSELTTMLAVSDFDILVRQSDAPRAITALLNAGFRTEQLRLDLFVSADFDKLHGCSLQRGARDGSIDIHWWPLPRWTNLPFVEELFDRSEFGSISDLRVRIPQLADHLFLALARPEPWEVDEIFARAVEVVHLLRGCGGDLDWHRVVQLCRRFHRNAMAEAILSFLRSELNLAVPDGVLSELRRTRSLMSFSEFSIRRKHANDRSSFQNFALRSFSLAQSHPKVSRSLLRTGGALLVSPDFHKAVLRAAQEELPRLPRRSAERVWIASANDTAHFVGSHTDYVAGFSYPQNDGRWTEGYSAVMTVPVAANIGTRVQVYLTVIPLLAAGRTHSTFEICGGRGLTTRTVLTTSSRLPARIEAEADVIATLGFRGVVLAFNLPNATRPRTLGLNADNRLLGLFVQDVEISADPP